MVVLEFDDIAMLPKGSRIILSNGETVITLNAPCLEGFHFVLHKLSLGNSVSLHDRGFVVACQSLGQIVGNNVLVLGYKHKLKRGFVLQMSQG
jgi:hypothetical protein